MSQGADGNVVLCPDASVQELIKGVTAQLWRSNALMVVNAVLVTIMVAVGAAGRHYRHAAVTRFLFLGASSLYLPIVSYVASSIGKESCSASGLDVFCHGRSYVALLLIWTVLVQIVGTNTTAIVAADDYHGGQKLGPWIELLARTAWTSYLVFYYAGRGFVTITSKHYTLDDMPFYKMMSRYVIVLCLLSLVKIMLKLYAFWKARHSYALGRNPYLIAGYMEKLLHGDDQLGSPSAGSNARLMPNMPPLIVMGEEKQKIVETPHGYTIEQANSSLVTVDMVWRMASSSSSTRGDGDDVLLVSHPWLKDLCLSFALFKMLTRRFAKAHLAECGSAKAFRFVSDVLLNNGSADRVFSVIADEISFVLDSYYSSMPTSNFGRLLPVLNISLSLSIITWCLAGASIVYHKYSNHRHPNQMFCRPEPDSCSLPSQYGIRIALGNILFNTVPTLSLFLAVVIAEAWEILSYLCSNWVKITMLCNYITHQSWQQSLCVQTLLGFLFKLRATKCRRRRRWSDHMGQRSLLLQGAHDEQKMQQQQQHAKVPVPPEVTAAIVDTLRSSNGGVLSKGTAALHRSRNGRQLLWACQGRGTSDVILTWHVATGIVLELEAGAGAGAGAGASSSISSSSSSEKKRAVAAHLSQYCAYLVADVPQLLPDDRAWSGKLYKALSRDIRRAVAAEHDGGGAGIVAVVAERCEQQVVKAGVRLGRQLMELVPDEEGRWALLESFWCEILLYSAPSDNLKAHQKAIARGGAELITLVWALLTHAGIVTRPN